MMKTPRSPDEATNPFENVAPLNKLLAELRSGLLLHWQIAHEILAENGVTLKKPTEESFSYSRNFFSLLFLYSFYRAEIPSPSRVFYAATLQCLRGMVTGCDNLLDDEYKMTLDTSIPSEGYRFRSVVDIMISDRVLFQLLLNAHHKGELPYEKIHQASSVSMKSMMRSGIQEASEEPGISQILPPKTVLETIHHLKTGILFTCPWDIPLAIENMKRSDVRMITDSLYTIGIGCQILDDMVDFFPDIKNKRHNYLVSLIYHGNSDTECKRLEDIMSALEYACSPNDINSNFPAATAMSAATARDHLERGLRHLFADEHGFMIAPAITFLEKRIAGPLNLRQL